MPQIRMLENVWQGSTLLAAGSDVTVTTELADQLVGAGKAIDTTGYKSALVDQTMTDDVQRAKAAAVVGAALPRARRDHTRILTGQFQASSTARNYHVLTTIEQGVVFDQVRLIFANAGATDYAVDSVAAASTSSAASASVPTEAWVVGAGFQVPARIDANTPSIAFSPWLDVAAVPMGDGSLRRLMLRGKISAVAHSISGVNSALLAGSAKWDVAGRILRSYWQATTSDYTSTDQSSFTQGSAQNTTAIIGWQVRSRARVMTFCGVGPSTTQGVGESGFDLDGWGLKMAHLASSQGMPVEWLNWGLASQTTAQCVARFEALISAGVIPGVAVLQAANSNDGAPSATTQRLQRAATQRFLAMCDEHNIFPVLTTGTPNDAAGWNAGNDTAAADRYNEILGMAENGIEVWDFWTPLAAAPGSLRYAAAYSTDGTHPNGAGHSRLASMYAPRLIAVSIL